MLSFEEKRKLTFSEQLQVVRARAQEDAVVREIRDWLRNEGHRFVPVEVNGDEVTLLADPERLSWETRNPAEPSVTRMLKPPRAEQPGAEIEQRGGNLGFSIYQNSQLTGHYAWPPSFDREAIPTGWTPHAVRQQLRRLGHLHHEPGRATVHLPSPLARLTVQNGEARTGAVGKKSQTQRRNPRVRVLALRGFFN